MSGTAASVEAKTVRDRIRKKMDEVGIAVEPYFSPILDHFDITLQQAYYRCASECFDRSNKQRDELKNCVDHCKVPVLQADNLVQLEVTKFQQQLERAWMVCEDKFKASKQNRSDLESCYDQKIQDSLRTMPALVERLKNDLSIPQ